MRGSMRGVPGDRHSYRELFQKNKGVTDISTLKGLGPKSEKCLNEIGVYTKEDLKNINSRRYQKRPLNLAAFLLLLEN